MLQWFSNPELLNTILTSTSDFLEVIDHVKDKDKGREQIAAPMKKTLPPLIQYLKS
jgi:hypothetical protein